MHVRVSLKRLIPFFFVLACVLTACSPNTTQITPHPKESPVTVVTHNLSTGCGKPPSQPIGLSTDATLRYAGLRRMYLLHIPSDYDNENAQPLVLNFHGHGSTDHVQESQTGMSILADQEDFIVAYPQGTIGQDHRTGWDTGPKTYPHVNDVLFTDNLITDLEATLCINPDRIYATGFSNGGGMTNLLACKLSDRIAAFAIVSGAVHPVEGGCHPPHPVSILDFHGTHDSVVPYIGNPVNDLEPPINQWLEDWAKLDSCTNGPTTFAQQARVTGEKWTHCKEDTTIIHYRIQGGIHIWPSLATDGGAINATPIIWSFLKNYSLKAAAKL
jgi:polyhydroxybutyrate depolymerase